MRSTICLITVVIVGLATTRCLADDKDEIIKLLKEVQQLKDQVTKLKEENEKLRQAAKDRPPAKAAEPALDKAIVGEWKNTSETETYTFDADGKYVHRISGTFGGSNRGKYRFDKDGLLQLIPTEGSFLGTAGTRVWRVELEGDKLLIDQRQPIMIPRFELQRGTKK